MKAQKKPKFKFSFIQRIPRPCMIPPFYGPFRYDYMNDCSLVMLMPFHLLAGLFFYIFSSINQSWRSVCMNPRDAFQQGYEAGKKARMRKAA